MPLVVAEVNPDAAEGHRGIIANPNCSTMQMVVALKPLQDEAGIERLVISTYQAVSGTGKAAVDELLEQSRAELDGRDPVSRDLSAPDRLQRPAAGGQLPGRRRPHRRGAQADQRDPQDPRRRRDPGQRDLRPGPGRHRPLRGRQRRDPRRALARSARGSCSPRRPASPSSTTRARPLPDGDRCRRPRRRLRRPDPPRPRQRAGDRHVDRLRQPAQGRGDQRRSGRRVARRARTCSG